MSMSFWKIFFFGFMYRISRLPKNRMIFEYILLSVIREIFFTTIKKENEVCECFFLPSQSLY